MPDSVDKYLKVFARAIIKTKVQDYNGSIDEYSAVINANPDFSLAYFNRGNTRYEIKSLINSMGNFNDVIYVGNGNSKAQQPQNIQKTVGQNYDDVIEDYNKCIRLDPGFWYAYYNLANVKAATNDYIGAIKSFSQAIEIEPKFAESYYNRGLTYIYIQEKEKGCLDLSKAGELGIDRAYAAISKFCNK
jgi:tetratricopeptide (TPR) repeat protein